jgi:hypothetical protein
MSHPFKVLILSLELVDATHFKPITLPCQENPSQSREYIIPCSPGDAEGSPLTFKEVAQEKLIVPRVTKVRSSN